MKIAFVIQRYGQEVNGGAELLCRGVAEHLVDELEIEILTTCAKDYITWKNEYPPGDTVINEVKIKRFPVEKKRNIKKFNRFSNKIFAKNNISEKDEVKWLYMQGPVCPKLLDFIQANKNDYDYFIFFTYLYYTTAMGLPLVAEKSLFVPTAHDELPLQLGIYKNMFRTTQAMIYSTKEEMDLVNQHFNNSSLESEIIGIGVDKPKYSVEAKEFSNKYSISNFILFAGRIEEGKGLSELFEFFIKYLESSQNKDLYLVLIGKRHMTIPDHPNILYLGFVTEQDKYNAIAAAKVTVVPSPLESLSIISLEAWLLSKPILVNGRSPVLKGNCQRSNGGLYYDNFADFKEKLNLLLNSKDVREKMGLRGQKYVEDNFSWPVVKRKYLSLLQRLG
ncbi:MAG TPA: glycosyltransferase [Candidatus Dependentiae bacterium]|nr:glycosyltransferase [Candidatus Dependentiae bacterium]